MLQQASEALLMTIASMKMLSFWALIVSFLDLSKMKGNPESVSSKQGSTKMLVLPSVILKELPE
jgi:hypothetical protein